MMREPWRTALMVFAIAVGVSVVLAIELAGNAAAGSFQSSVETLSGNTNLEVIAAGGVPDGIVGKLASLPFPIELHPRIEDFAVVVDTGQTLPLIGLDLIGESNAVREGTTPPVTAEEDALQHMRRERVSMAVARARTLDPTGRRSASPPRFIPLTWGG